MFSIYGFFYVKNNNSIVWELYVYITTTLQGS